jgi:hypothetical protein
LDVSPLGKMVYTNGEVDQEDINEVSQDPQILRELVEKLISAFRSEPKLPSKLGLQAGETKRTSALDLKAAMAELMTDPAKAAEFFEEEANQFNQRKINMFVDYYNSGELVEHLEIVLKSIDCYISKGALKIYFTAG